MNQQLQAQLTQILAQISLSVGEAKDFTVAQLPDIVQQYITYGIWSTVVNIIFCILFGVIGVIIFKFCLNKLKVCDNYDGQFGWAMGAIVSVMFFILIPTSILIQKINSMILILTVPKVWFILELKNLIS